VVDSAKYLGLSIHKSLKWNDHINQVSLGPCVLVELSIGVDSA
jgi:hypothetical protein